MFEVASAPGYKSQVAEAGETEEGAARSGVWLERRFSGGTLNLPQFEAYLNSILARIQEQWPGDKPAARVKISPTRDYNAYAHADGTIILPMGMLEDAENEDQVAFVLAHEYAHIILGHNHLNSYRNMSRKASAAVDLGFDAKHLYKEKQETADGTTENVVGGKTDKRTNYMYAADKVNASILAPVYGQELEREADLLGLDLLIRAGYSTNGASRALLAVKSGQERDKKIAAELAEIREKQRSESFSAAGDQALSGDTSGGIGAFFDELVSTGVFFVDEIEVDSHPDAKDRLDDLKAYINNHYKTRARVRVKKETLAAARAEPQTRARLDQYLQSHQARLDLDNDDIESAIARAKRGVGGDLSLDPITRQAFYEVRKYQGQTDRAVQNLELALQSEQAPLNTYQQLAEEWTLLGQYDNSLRALGQAEAKFGEVPGSLPIWIAAYKGLNNSEKVSTLMVKCRLEGTGLTQKCRRAAGQIEAEAAE
ncbi:MAG: M48 family metalloprotease [Pseudomonadota bacterium]